MRAAYAACMTITEDLNFSVLTAPLAAVDRRALSQAWYSALYAPQAAPARQSSERPQMPRAQRSTERQPSMQRDVPDKRQASPPEHARELFAAGAPQTERRAARTPLATKIQRALVHRGSAPRRAAFALEGDRGRVQVMLQLRGPQLILVALCAPPAAPQVARALEQARYSLALRGIDLHAQTRECAPC